MQQQQQKKKHQRFVEPLERRVLMTVTLGTNFRGMTFSDTIGYVPPDTIAAVGPSHIVECINANIAIYDKSGNQLSKQTLSSFFSGFTHGSIISDPQVLYDDVSNRFVVAVADISPNAQTSNIDFAVSNTSDPTQGFSEKQQINTKEFVALQAQNAGKTFFSDFPRMGFNADVYTLTFNMFGFPLNATSPYDHVQVLNIVKSSVLDANSATLTTTVADRNGLSNSTMTPASMHGATAGLPMVFVQETLNASGLPTGSAVRLDIEKNPATAPTFADLDISVPAYQVGALGATPPANQPAAAQITTNDSRILNVSYLGGYLVASQTVGLSGVANARWYMFDIVPRTGHPLPTLVQSGNITRTSLSTYFPSVEINRSGDIAMTFMESGSTEYMSMYVTGRKWTDPLGTMQIPRLVKAGEAAYSAFGDTSPYRAGDFSGISVDPTNGSFWAANEYATAKNFGIQFLANWGTWIGNFTVTSGPTSASGTAINGGALPPRVSLFDASSDDPMKRDELLV